VVATNHGEQAIGTLKVGEKVVAYNPKTHKMELEPIQHVWINRDNDLVDLTLTTTTRAPHSTVVTKHSEVIHTNQKHPFFTLEHGFVPVAHLHLGMHMLRADGSVGVVTGWKLVPGTQVMYNLTVAQDHTFTVGAGQWVVHNTCPFAPGAEQHILEGSNGGGYHWDGDPNTPGEVVPGTETAPDAHGVYEAQVKVNGVQGCCKVGENGDHKGTPLQ
jgi:Pretoxin HINT domain